jgi:perosamine synthetase
MPSDRIPLSEPLLQGREWAYVKECLDSGWVSSVGSFVNRFEDMTAQLTGAPHAVAVVNGTSGLHVALKAAGVEAGDGVLVSNLTFVAPVHAICYAGAVPVFMDADPETWQMDAKKVARFLETECVLEKGICRFRKTGMRIRALLPVHILGLACEMDTLMELARRYSLLVIEDAAEGVGVRYRGRSVGTWGDIGVLSFNGNKIITTGGGGMVLTRDQRLGERVRYLTTQAKDDAVEYIHREIGYNYRLTNIQAALGVAQMEQLDRFIQRKREIAAFYTKALGDLEDLTLMPSPPNTEATFWLYTVLLPSGTTVPERQAFRIRLFEQGIETRPLWHPISTLPPYADFSAFEIEQSPQLYARALSLPSSPSLSDADLRRVSDQFHQAYRDIRKVSRVLR